MTCGAVSLCEQSSPTTDHAFSAFKDSERLLSQSRRVRGCYAALVRRQGRASKESTHTAVGEDWDDDGGASSSSSTAHTSDDDERERDQEENPDKAVAAQQVQETATPRFLWLLLP